MEGVSDPGFTGQDLAGQGPIDIGRIQQDARENYDRLSQVFRTQVIEGVQVRVVNSSFIIEGILNELKRRQAEPAQENVVRRIRRLRDHGGCAQACKRGQ